MDDFQLIHGDCLNAMPNLEAESVDMVLADPPYGTTACKWDSIIDLVPMWEQLKRIIRPRGAIVMTASQPFTTTLISSCRELFQYEWAWDKISRYTGFLDAKRKPLKRHESVIVFAVGRTTYNPQMGQGNPYRAKRSGRSAPIYAEFKVIDGQSDGKRYPCSILPIAADVKSEMGLHHTQKPISLMEYLIKTYTNEGETVLDFAMGSGTTGVACANLGRRFIGIELDKDYFAIAKKRIDESRHAAKVSLLRE